MTTTVGSEHSTTAPSCILYEEVLFPESQHNMYKHTHTHTHTHTIHTTDRHTAHIQYVRLYLCVVPVRTRCVYGICVCVCVCDDASSNRHRYAKRARAFGVERHLLSLPAKKTRRRQGSNPGPLGSVPDSNRLSHLLCLQSCLLQVHFMQTNN